MGQSGLHATLYTGSYSMKNMKRLLKETGLPVTRNYTGGLNFEIGYSGGASRNTFGVYYNHINTEGVATQGSSMVKHYANREVLGFLDYIEIKKYLHAGVKLGFDYSALRIKTEGLTPAYDTKFNSIGFLIAPTVLWTYSIGVVDIRAEASYELNQQGITTQNGDTSVSLVTGDGKSAKMNWSGYRVGVGIAYKFQKRNSSRQKMEYIY